MSHDRDGVANDDGAQAPDQSLLTVLTTEHLTLQGARASAIGESSVRAALFVGAAFWSRSIARAFVDPPSAGLGLLRTIDGVHV